MASECRCRLSSRGSLRKVYGGSGAKQDLFSLADRGSCDCYVPNKSVLCQIDVRRPLATPAQSNRIAAPIPRRDTPTSLKFASVDCRCVSNGTTLINMGVKDAGVRIRVEKGLRDGFLEACRRQDTPAAQVLRQFMREYVAEHSGDGAEPRRKTPGTLKAAKR